ncbi:MAG: glycosyltransferase family 2 protein [Puia sp.]|nr:glycosyltransferase family 2 protein [Puia sp.]
MRSGPGTLLRQTMDLSIIIVNYKTPALLLDCLRTVYGQTSGISFETLVVDNASGDDSRERILSAFPAVKWIQMDYNAGFARANNEAMRQSGGKSILLLNSDTLVEKQAISRCFRLFSDSGYIACGVQLLNEDGSPQISGNYFVPGGLNYLLPLPYAGAAVKWLATVTRAQRPNVPDSKGLVEVDWINGAFLMVKRTAIDLAGLMDEDFFLYAEEAEWCSRLGRYGKLCIFGQVNIIHLQGGSSEAGFDSSDKHSYNLYDRKGYQMMVSNFVRIRKQYGPGWFLLHLAFYLAEIPLFFTGLLLTSVAGVFSRRRPRYSFLQAGQYTLNVFRLTGLAPTIIRNRPHFYKTL